MAKSAPSHNRNTHSVVKDHFPHRPQDHMPSMPQAPLPGGQGVMPPPSPVDPSGAPPMMPPPGA